MRHLLQIDERIIALRYSLYSKLLRLQYRLLNIDIFQISYSVLHVSDSFTIFFTFSDGKVFHQTNCQCFVILFYWISKFLQKRVYCFILVHIFCLLANKQINYNCQAGEGKTIVSSIDYIISLLNQSSNTLSARTIPSFSMVIISLSTKLFFIRSIFDLLPKGYISETV